VVPWACPLHQRACVHLSLLPGPSLCVIIGLVCTCFSSPTYPLCCRACVFFFRLPSPPSVPHVLYALERFVCHISLSMPGPPSAQGLCELERFVYLPSLGTLGLPSDLWGFCGLLLVSQAHHSWWAVYGLRSAAFSVFCLLSPCFASFLRFCSTPLCLHERESPSAWEIFLPQDTLPYSGNKLLSRSSPSFPFLFLHPLSIYSFSSLNIFKHNCLKDFILKQPSVLFYRPVCFFSVNRPYFFVSLYAVWFLFAENSHLNLLIS